MNKSPNTYEDFIDKSPLSKEVADAHLKKTTSIVSTFEWLRDRRKAEQQKHYGSELDAWFVYFDDTQSEEDKESLARLEIDCDAIVGKRDKEIDYKEGEENDQRRFDFRKLPYASLDEHLEGSYSCKGDAIEIPEVVMVLCDKTSRGAEIPNKVKDYAEEFIEGMYSENRLANKQVESFLEKFSKRIYRSKMPSNIDSVVQFCVANFDAVAMKDKYGAYAEYFRTNNQEEFARSISTEAIRCMLEKAQSIDGNEVGHSSEALRAAFYRAEDDNDEFWPEKLGKFARAFRQQVDHAQEEKEWNEIDFEGMSHMEYSPATIEGGKAADAYQDYRKKLMDFAKTVDLEQIQEAVSKMCAEILCPILDEFKNEYVKIKAKLDWERKILQPVVVAVSADPDMKEKMMESGADMVVSQLPADKIEKLIRFVARMKTNPASLSVESLRKKKQEFYRAVEGKLDERSEVTAETGKEIEILQEIFQKNSCKNILDVGCGNGRIDIPLLRSGYTVTGVEGNESFLLSVMRKAADEELFNASFKKGDVIDYAKQVQHGSQDAVIYTWHTILEAFGPGNLLTSLNNAWLSLKQGGVLVFDQPTRENPHMEEGWYGNEPDSENHYLAYIMDEGEIRFILDLAGFSSVEIKHWETRSNEEYPEGMKKITVSAKKF